MYEFASTHSLLLECQTGNIHYADMSALRNDSEMLTTLLALCKGKHRSPEEFIHKRSVIRSIDEVDPNKANRF